MITGTGFFCIRFYIKSFPQQKLTRNIEKEEDAIEFAKRLENTSRILNTLIGKNYVPAYPIYIIAVLFASDAATKIDLSASTHAYFYELIIKVVIARGRNNLEYDITASYLSFLAYSMFKNRSDFTEKEYRETHSSFEDKYEIRRPFDKKKAQLISQHILSEQEGVYKFKHNFMYYYFVASFLKDNLYKDDRIQEDIKAICGALYVEEYANILLFLAHLSKDPFIIDQLKHKALTIFKGIPYAELDKDVGFLGDISDKLEKLTLDDMDKQQARQKMLREKDKDESLERGFLLRYDGPVRQEVFDANPLLQLISSLKTIEILGQILKNYPGTIEGSEKFGIAECCYCLGLRTLAFSFEVLKENEEGLISDIVKIVRERHLGEHEREGSIDETKIKRLAREAIINLTQILSFSLIRRISLSVGTPELFPIYKKLVDKMEVPSVQLIDCSLQIDQANSFPDAKIIKLSEAFSSKWLALDILRKLVVQHLYLFEVPRPKIQRVCAKLSIRYKLLQAVDPKRKMIESKVLDSHKFYIRQPSCECLCSYVVFAFPELTALSSLFRDRINCF